MVSRRLMKLDIPIQSTTKKTLLVLLNNYYCYIAYLLVQSNPINLRPKVSQTKLYLPPKVQNLSRYNYIISYKRFGEKQV